MKEAWVLSYPISAQRRLWSEKAETPFFPGWSESSLGAQSLYWFCHAEACIIQTVPIFHELNITCKLWWRAFLNVTKDRISFIKTSIFPRIDPEKKRLWSEKAETPFFPGWSESSLGAQSLYWFCHAEACIIQTVPIFHELNITCKLWWRAFLNVTKDRISFIKTSIFPRIDPEKKFFFKVKTKCYILVLCSVL